MAEPAKVAGDADDGENTGQSPVNLPGTGFGYRSHRGSHRDHDQCDQHGLFEVQAECIDQGWDGHDGTATAE